MKKKILLIMLGILLCASFAFGAAGDVQHVVGSVSTAVSTNGYGGATADLAADEAYDWSSDIDWPSTGVLFYLVYLEHDSAGTTDNIVLGIVTSPDSTDFASNPICSIEYDATSGSDTQEDYVIVYPCYSFRIGVKTTGTTDTFDYRTRYVPVYGTVTQ